MLRQVEAFTSVVIASLPGLVHYLEILKSGRLQIPPRSTSFPPDTTGTPQQTSRPPQESGGAGARTVGLMEPPTVMEQPGKARGADLESGVPTEASSSEQSSSQQNVPQDRGSSSTGDDGQSPSRSRRVSNELGFEDATITRTLEFSLHYDFYQASGEEAGVDGGIELEKGKGDGDMGASSNAEEVIDVTAVRPSHSREASESGATAVSRRLSVSVDGEGATSNGSKSDSGGTEARRGSDDKQPTAPTSEVGGSRGHHEQYGYKTEDLLIPDTLPPNRERGVRHGREPSALAHVQSSTGENKLHPGGWPLPPVRRPSSPQARMPNTQGDKRELIPTRSVSIRRPGPGNLGGKEIAAAQRNHPSSPTPPQPIRPAHHSSLDSSQKPRRKTTGSAAELSPFPSPRRPDRTHRPSFAPPLRREASVTGVAQVVTVASAAETKHGSIINVLPSECRPGNRRGSARGNTSRCGTPGRTPSGAALDT